MGKISGSLLKLYVMNYEHDVRSDAN